MIERYYVVTVKDREGFTKPLLNAKGVPDLFPNEREAKASLEFLRRLYQSRLEPGHTEKRKPKAFGFFKPKDIVEPSYTEEQKKEMRWFLANASVQGVVIKT